MTWTYQPVKTPKDQLRLLIGDTDINEPLLQDEELEYLLNIYNHSPMNSAIRACELIMAKFSRLADESVGSVSIQFSQKVKSYMEMRNDLVTRLCKEDMTPVCGGISVSQKTRNNLDKDRVQPMFENHMMENQLISPWTTQSFADFLLYRL